MYLSRVPQSGDPFAGSAESFGGGLSIDDDLARLERLLDASDAWRDLQHLDARELRGDTMDPAETARIRLTLTEQLAQNPFYRRRGDLLEARAHSAPITRSIVATLPYPLTAIDGLDAEMAVRLASLGVASIAAIADWTPADVAYYSATLGLGWRIDSEDWVGQARRLNEHVQMPATTAEPKPKQDHQPGGAPAPDLSALPPGTSAIASIRDATFNLDVLIRNAATAVLASVPTSDDPEIELLPRDEIVNDQCEDQSLSMIAMSTGDETDAAAVADGASEHLETIVDPASSKIIGPSSPTLNSVKPEPTLSLVPPLMDLRDIAALLAQPLADETFIRAPELSARAVIDRAEKALAQARMSSTAVKNRLAAMPRQQPAARRIPTQVSAHAGAEEASVQIVRMSSVAADPFATRAVDRPAVCEPTTGSAPAIAGTSRFFKALTGQ